MFDFIQSINLSIVDKYLIFVNVLGFVCLIVNNLLYSFTENGQIDPLLTILGFAGGAIGITIALLLSRDKPEKETMMSRVFAYSMCVIQVVILLYYYGFHKDELNLKIITFFSENKVLLLYLLIINIIALVVYAMDKIAALEHRWRFRIVTLLGIAFAGGSIGALFAMYLFRHKTRQDYFAIGIPLIIIMQIIVIFYLMNV